MPDAFSRERMLLGDDAVERLRNSHVIVFGLGGVGSFAVEALARAGVGELTLVDHDTVSLTNLNRQLYALHSTQGRLKAEVACERVRDINPRCRVHMLAVFYLPECAEEFFERRYDYIVDAIDTVSAKIDLACRAQALGIPIISCMGTGNKLDPSRFEIADIYETQVCPLCRVMRRELKKRGVQALRVVFSREEPRKLAPCAEEGEKRAVPGSVSFVPPTAGLLLAGEVIRAIAVPGS